MCARRFGSEFAILLPVAAMEWHRRTPYRSMCRQPTTTRCARRSSSTAVIPSRSDVSLLRRVAGGFGFPLRHVAGAERAATAGGGGNVERAFGPGSAPSGYAAHAGARCTTKPIGQYFAET